MSSFIDLIKIDTVIVTVILTESILPTLTVLVPAQVDFGNLEAAKQITEVRGQMVMTLPLILKKSVVVPSTQLSKHKRMVPLKVHSTDIWPNKQIKYLGVILDRNCSRAYT